MEPARRIAVMFDPDALDLRRRGLLRGIRRYAAEAPRWHAALDPYAIHRRPADCHGIIAPAGRRLTAGLDSVAVPLVCVTWGLTRKSLIRVLANRYAAGTLAARHLIERGYRTFGYLGFKKRRESLAERQCFCRELRVLGWRADVFRTDVTYAQRVASWDGLMADLGQWLERLEPPAGILAARPGLARSLADLAARRGIRIPQDLGIIAADNDPLLCEPPPALTSIHFDYAEIGYRAAQVLDGLLDPGIPPHRSILIDPTLVTRTSTDREGAAEPLLAKALWFIDSHRTEPIGARDVAEALGVALRTLEQRFRRIRGRSISQEIVRARVEHAKLHLTHSVGNLPAIAHDSGFPSYQAMLRAFNRHVGMSPSAWRRQAERRRRGAHDAEQHKKRPSTTRRPRIDGHPYPLH